MSFPSTQEINLWFQNAHTSAIAAGGSVYVMEKHAEQEVVKYVLRHAYVTILEELHDLNYPNNSRISVRVTELLDQICNINNVDDTKDNEFVDDYNDDEDEDEDTTKKEYVINLNTCKTWQKLRLRNGKIVTYAGNTNLYEYPHSAGGKSYTSQGEYYDDGEQSEYDIVEILPIEDQDVDKESSVEINEDLLREVTTALLKALIASK